MSGTRLVFHRQLDNCHGGTSLIGMKQNPNDNAFEIVRAGYDKIAGRYTTEREKFDNWNELEEFQRTLPEKARVLDVGCGTGVPVARHLTESGCEVVGIDMSKKMVAVAAQNVPEATFMQMNMTELDFPPESFDGLISCYAIIHVPRECHAAIFQAFYSALKPEGTMLVSVACWAWEEVATYMGEKMFWSHHDPAVTESLIIEAGFVIEFGRAVESGDEKHHWILARKG